MKGFTLVEVMVATVLLSLVMALSFSALYTGTRSWQVGETRMERNDDFRTGLHFLRKYISQLSPMLQQDENEVITMFKGDEETMHFITALPAHTGGSGLNLVSLYTDDPEDQSNLYMAYQPALPGIEPDANFEDSEVAVVELMSNIERVEFEYYGIRGDSDEPEWYTTWDEERLFPTGIRVILTPTEPSHLIPDLTIPVYLSDVRGMNQFVMNTTATNEQDQPGYNTRARARRSGGNLGGMGGGMGGASGGEINIGDLERSFPGGMGSGSGMGGGMGRSNQ